MNYGLTLPAPDGPVNPAEAPIAELVLEAACFELHDPRNYNALYLTLEQRHPNLREELHHRMRLGPFRAAMAVAR
jgi:hypothetical protein